MKIKIISRTACLCAGMLCLNLSIASAANIFKADMPDNLNLGTSWTGNVAPGASDIAVWDHTVVNNLSSSPGDNLSWQGIQILDPAGPIAINADGNTLTNGASGIDLSLATTGLTLNNPVVLGASQTWAVTNGQTLTVAGVVSGTDTLATTGGGEVLLSGANTYSGGTVINGGIVEPDNAACFGTGGVTNSGTMLFDVFSTAGIIANAFTVPETCAIDGGGAGSGVVLDGSWSGAGTIQITNIASGETITLGGNGGGMDSFTGSVAVTDPNSAGTVRFNNGGGNGNTGNSAMTMDLGNSSMTFLSRNKNAPVTFGALKGGPNTKIQQGSSSSGTTTYTIGALNLDTTFAGAINDAQSSSALVAITKVGTGALTLSGNNTYGGTTTISGGTLQIGDGVTSGTGTLGIGTGVIVNNATLVLNRPDDFTVYNSMSGSGTTIKTNANIVTYDGTDTSTGPLVISQGTLALAGSVSAPISVASGAYFDVSENGSFALSSTLSGQGTVLGMLTASGGTISPDGVGAAGTLTFSNGLSETGGANNQMELSTPGGTNDLINVVGDLDVSGVNNINATAFDGGTIPSGTYTLITYSGNFNGDLTNFTVNAIGVTGTLTNLPNQIALIVSSGGSLRGPTNLTWVGSNTSSNWDVDVSSNWESGSTLFSFLPNDSVRFDDTGAAYSTVNIAATVTPASVTVDSTANYTFTGNGDISGSTGLTKTNSGTLTILTTNSYTGPTIVSEGTLAVSDLEIAGTASGIGAASIDPANLMFNGATLDYLGAASTTDRGATLNGAGVNIQVADSTANLTLNGGLVGTGELTVPGPGTLTLGGANTYSGGTFLSGGIVHPDNASCFGVGGVTNDNSYLIFDIFPNGGIIANSNYVDGTVTLDMANRSGSPSIVLDGAWLGSGTILVTNITTGETLTLGGNGNGGGNMNNFTGSVVVADINSDSSASAGSLRFNNGGSSPNVGSSNVLFNLGQGSAQFTEKNGGITTYFGALIGGPNTELAKNENYVIGGLNLNTTFAGTIQSSSSLVKVDTGTLTLTGNNPYTGSTTVSSGVLALSYNAATGDGSIGGSTNIFIASGATLDVSGRSDGTMPLNSGQTLGGSGIINGSVDNTAGGNIAPGDAATIGTLTVTTNVNLGGTLVMKINREGTPNSDQLAASAIALQSPTIIVTNIGPGLRVGDTFTLLSGSLSGSIGSVTLPGTDYYTWDTSQLAVNGTISVTAALPPPTISSVDVSALASGSITINAANGAANGAVNVLMSTNLTLPLDSWTPVYSGNFDGSGNLNATISVDSTQSQQYYILQAQ
jgi:autotransporter-associated beta strand protein